MNKLRIMLITFGCLFASNQVLAVPNYSVDQNPMPGAQVTTSYNHNAGGRGITPYYGYYVTEFPSLNDYGLIAGRTDVANSPHPLIKGQTSGQAAVWENGIVKNIIFYNSCRDVNEDGIADASACGSRALAISNHGQVGGSSNVNRPGISSYFERSIAWWPSKAGNYDEESHRESPISYYAPSQSQIEDINGQANVVGTGITVGGAGPKDGLAHGLVYIDRGKHYIGVQYQVSRAHALNENNHVTGAVIWNDTDDYSYGVPRSLKAYTWFAGELNVVQDGITDAAHVSEGYDINDSDLVVGLMGWNNDIRAFKWASPEGSLEDLGTLGGTQSVARSVNNAGTIVGWANTSDGSKHAFIYENGIMYDLNDYVSGDPDFVIVDAYSINEIGQILVRAYKSSSQNQYWLLTDPDSLPTAPPEPEPAPVNVESVGVFGGTDDETSVKIMADAEGNTISIGYYNRNDRVPDASTIDFDPSIEEDIHTLKLTSPNKYEGIYIQKLDAKGNYLWTKTLPGNLVDRGFSNVSVEDLFVEPDGSFHIVGVVKGRWVNLDINPDPSVQELIEAQSIGDRSFRASYSSHGYLISSETVRYVTAKSVAVDSDKNIYVAYVTGFFGADIDFDPGVGVAKVQLESQRSAIVVTKTSRDSLGVERLEWAKSMSSIGRHIRRNSYEDNYAHIYDVSIAAPAIEGEGPMLAFTYKGAINFQAYDSNLGLRGDSQIVNTEGTSRSGLIRMSESEEPGALWMIPESIIWGSTKVKLVRSGDYFGLMTRTNDSFFNYINNSYLFHGMAEYAGISNLSRVLKGDSKGIGMNRRGDVYISGYTYAPTNFDSAGYDLKDRFSSYVTKINVDGSYGWTFSHPGVGSYVSVAPDHFGNVTMVASAGISLETLELLTPNSEDVRPNGGGYRDGIVTRISPLAGSVTGAAAVNPANIVSTSISLSQSALPGELATYTVTVTSLGDTTMQVNLSLDALDFGITAVLADTSLTPPVGGSVTTTLSVLASDDIKDDSYSIRVLFADKNNQLFSNAITTLKILRPRFETSISPPIQQVNPGDSITYDIVFKSIDELSTTFALSAVSPHESITISMSPAQVVLEADGTATARITVSTDAATPAATYTFTIVATDGQYTRNVHARFYFTGIDLELTRLVLSSPGQQIYGGERLLMELTVRNGGDLVAVSPDVVIYLSSDATITTEDIQIATFSIRRLNGQYSSRWNSRYVYSYNYPQIPNIPVNLLGTYYVGAIVDSKNKHVESNEDNNVIVANSTVEIIPDL